jgi:hypothetical protein
MTLPRALTRATETRHLLIEESIPGEGHERSSASLKEKQSWSDGPSTAPPPHRIGRGGAQPRQGFHDPQLELHCYSGLQL